MGLGAGEIATPPLVQIATCGGLSAGIDDNGQLFAWDGPVQWMFPQEVVSYRSPSGPSTASSKLEEDGTAVTWGQNDQGQCNVPSGLDVHSGRCRPLPFHGNP